MGNKHALNEHRQNQNSKKWNRGKATSVKMQ